MMAFPRAMPSINVKSWGLGYWFLGIFLAVFMGLMAAVLPYWFIIAVVVIPIFPFIAWIRPEYGVVAILAIGSGLIKQQFLPMIPVLGGSIAPADLALLMLIPIVLIKAHGRSAKLLNGIRPFVWPMGLLAALIVFSMLNAKFFFGTSAKDILGESHHFLHWLFAPMLVLMLDDETKLRRLVKGLWVIGILFSIGQVIQSVFGIWVFGQGVVGTVKTVGHEYAGVYRSQSSGITFSILALYLVVAGYLLKERNASRSLPFAFLFVVAILVSFGRGIWATTLLGLGAMAFSLGFEKGMKLMVAFALTLVVGVGLVGAYKPESVSALKDRALSAREDAERGSSLNWRFYENKMAMNKLEQHPVFGIGLGTAYRPPSGSDVTPEETRYIHNGFLYLALKLGPLSLLVLTGIVIAFFRVARGLLRAKLPARHHAMVVAAIALFSQLLVLSLTQPEFLMMSWGIGVIAVLIGILGAMRNLLVVPEQETPARQAGATVLPR